MYDKIALIALVREKALKFGEFTLVSGRKASYYLDGKQVTLDPAGSLLVAEGILDLLANRVAEGQPMPAAAAASMVACAASTASGRSTNAPGSPSRPHPRPAAAP